jgi:hypothetical protein
MLLSAADMARRSPICSLVASDSSYMRCARERSCWSDSTVPRLFNTAATPALSPASRKAVRASASDRSAAAGSPWL